MDLLIYHQYQTMVHKRWKILSMFSLCVHTQEVEIIWKNTKHVNLDLWFFLILWKSLFFTFFSFSSIFHIQKTCQYVCFYTDSMFYHKLKLKKAKQKQKKTKHHFHFFKFCLLSMTSLLWLARFHLYTKIINLGKASIRKLLHFKVHVLLNC